MYLSGNSLFLLIIAGSHKFFTNIQSCHLWPRHLRHAAYLSAFNYEVHHCLAERESHKCRLFVKIFSSKHSIQLITGIETETKKDPELWKLVIELRQSNKVDTEFMLCDDTIFRGSTVVYNKISTVKYFKLIACHTLWHYLNETELTQKYCYWPSIDQNIENWFEAANNLHYTKSPLHRYRPISGSSQLKPLTMCILIPQVLRMVYIF